MTKVARSQAVALVLASCLICFIVSEVLVRVADLAPDDIQYWSMNLRHADNVLDESPHYAFQFSTDGRGLRDVPSNKQTTDDPLKIAYIGDSFVFGLGVDDSDTVPAQLAHALLKDDQAASFQVYNFGIPGIGPQQYLHIASKYTPTVEPDVVLIGVLNYNDLIGHNPPVRRSVEEINNSVSSLLRREEQPVETPWANPGDTPLYHSAVFRFLHQSYVHNVYGIDWRTYKAKWPGPSGNRFENPGFDCNAAITTTKICTPEYPSALRPMQREAFEHYRENGRLSEACNCEENAWTVHAFIAAAGIVFENNFLVPEIAPAVRDEVNYQLAILKEVVAQVRAAGAQPIITVFTAGFMVEPESFDPVLYAFKDTAPLRRTTALNDMVIDFCKTENVPCFDPLRSFRTLAEQPGADPLYIAGDGHMTARGNRIYAQMLAEAYGSLILQSKKN